MNNLDNKILNKIDCGYVYFVYSNIVNMVYVGETDNMKRIQIYESIINEKSSSKRFMLYNFYTKHKYINYDLAYDLVNSKNEFKIEYIESIFHKYLEKSYIRFLIDNGIGVYNKKLYKNHIYDIEDLDLDVIKNIK